MNFEKPADYIFIPSESKWIVHEKPPQNNFKNVGDFRRELDKLKKMRRQSSLVVGSSMIIKEPVSPVKPIEEASIPETIIKVNEQLDLDHMLLGPMPLVPPNSPKLFASPASNPLIDQTVTVMKPVKWIDCISRESKRVFVRDRWIVARIQLPTVLKDSVGLKRITRKEI